VKGGCRYCDKEDHAAERKRQRDLKLELERQKKQEQYAKQLAEAQEEIARLRNIQSDHLRDAERERILKQHQEEIESLQTPAKSSEFPSQPETVTSAKNAAPQGSSAATVNTQPDPGSTNVPNVAPKKEPTRTTSAAQNDWEYQKKFMNAQVSEVDRLMQMIGLESVKEKFLSIKANVDVAVRQGVDLNKNRYGTILLGNPGTGKTTVARLYASFLKSVGIIPGEKFIETSGSKLTNDGVSGCRKMLEEIQQSGGGVLFIDEAYQLVQGGSYGGSAVLDFLLTEVENLTGKVGFIIAGYQRQMEAFLAHNPGLPSRFPHKMKFQDMEDEELRQVLAHRVETTYRQKMKVEEGLDGLYCRIVARRIGRGRGREGFANARAVENAVVKITERQSVRLKKERRLSKAKVDDFLLTKEDLIGPEPSAAVKNSKAWKDLQSLIGLSTVKETIEVLLKTISFNYQRELNELPPVEYTLNKVFLGSPGTGKTTIAKLYGQILVDLGMLSNGEGMFRVLDSIAPLTIYLVVVRNPSDFVGDVVGASEKKTKGILASTQGKVLVIDEAYGLFASNKTHGTGGWRDPFRTAVVDTLVAEVQSTPGEDRCVLLLGYKDLMQQMFQDVNPGLSRRFPLDQAFTFEDFTREELDEILIMKVKQQGFVLTDRGRRVALEAVERARNRPNFGNAGEIDILLNAAKTRQQGRLAATNPADSLANTLDAADFDKDFDRADQDGSTIKKLFEGVVGCDDIVSQLERYYRTVKNCRQFGLDPRGKVPFNFLFRGPPGK
jgi:SpoVK/Ycf46/Vps4 family AAA+-type ATPase